MGAVAKGLAAPVEFEFEGSTWKLSPWTYAVQEAYETHLEGIVFKKLKRQRLNLTATEYDDMLRAATRDIATGVYTFGTELVAESLRSLSNMKMMVLIMLKQGHPTLGMEFVDRVFDDEVTFKEIMARMNAANSDPNGQTPAPPAGAR